VFRKIKGNTNSKLDWPAKVLHTLPSGFVCVCPELRHSSRDGWRRHPQRRNQAKFTVYSNVFACFCTSVTLCVARVGFGSLFESTLTPAWFSRCTHGKLPGGGRLLFSLTICAWRQTFIPCCASYLRTNATQPQRGIGHYRTGTLFICHVKGGGLTSVAKKSQLTRNIFCVKK